MNGLPAKAGTTNGIPAKAGTTNEIAEPAPDSAATTPGDYSIPGFRIQLGGPGAQWALVIRAAEKQENWEAYRKRRYPAEIVKPATTIRYKGGLFRVAEAEETSGGWVYRLTRWPANEVIARLVELTADTVARERKEREALRRQARLSTPSIFYEFVFGFLPARVQERMAKGMFFSPVGASRKSGFVQFLAFFALTALSLVGAFAAALGGGESSGGLLLGGLAYFAVAVEGAVRWGHAASAGQPWGFTPLEVLDRLLYRRQYKTKKGME